MTSSSVEPSVSITRTAQVPLDEVTIASLTQAGKTVGAPTDATLYTGGSMLKNGTDVYSAQSVVFTWVEKT